MSWSSKYKRSIDCDSPKGFSQKAHCAARKKRSKGEFTKSKSPFNEMHQVKSHKSVEEIAKKHRLDVSFIKNQLKMGIPIEHEHTKDKDLATDIALQHLDEIPDYYTRLKKMESDAKKHHKKFKDVKEHCGCEEDAIQELESGLKKLNNTSYDSIDNLMRRIMKKHDMSAKQLHNAFVNKHDKTPDSWIKNLKEGTLHHWFKGSRSKGGKPGWVQSDGSPCANEPGETKTPKCFSSGRLKALKRKGKKGEALIKSAIRRKREQDPGQQDKSGSAKPTMVKTFAKGKKDPRYVKAEPGIKEAMELNEAQKDRPGKGSGKKDACYNKVRSRYRVWPSAYASGALVKCRKVGAQNWGVKSEDANIETTDDMDSPMHLSPIHFHDNVIRYCPKCMKDERASECKYGKKYWKLFSMPSSLTKKHTPNTPHPGNFPESFEINPESHKKLQRREKIRNLVVRGATEGERQAASKKLGSSIQYSKPKLKENSITIEDANGNSFAEFIDIIGPNQIEPIVDEGCWKGYKQVGMKPKSGKSVPNCVPVDEAKGHGGSPGQEYIDPTKGKTFSPAPKDFRKMFNIGPRGSVGQDPKNSPGNTNSATSDSKKTFEQFMEDWQKVNRQDKTDGLSSKAVKAYRRENPGSKLQTAVTEKKPKGKRAKRRASFCRRMKGMKSKLTSTKTARDPDSRINKALRRWNCH